MSNNGNRHIKESQHHPDNNQIKNDNEGQCVGCVGAESSCISCSRGSCSKSGNDIKHPYEQNGKQRK